MTGRKTYSYSTSDVGQVSQKPLKDMKIWDLEIFQDVGKSNSHEGSLKTDFQEQVAGSLILPRHPCVVYNTILEIFPHFVQFDMITCDQAFQ